MKKFVIIQASVDGPTMDDDGLTSCLGFGLASNKLFDTKEEAEKELVENIIPTDMADLKECYLGDEEDEELEERYDFLAEDGMWGRKELNVYDGCDIINSTAYDIQEVEF